MDPSPSTALRDFGVTPLCDIYTLSNDKQPVRTDKDETKTRFEG